MTLPKFLLAWSDFNWCWVYRWLRPARDARWSILRTLGLTVSFGALGGLLGFLLGLVLFRQPVGWLPWLLGLLGLCCGICWFGITAICWNQRAALLRANPGVATALPKARFPFFRWCLGLVYLAVIGVITPLALLVTVENIRGELAWKRERARLVAAGEKLTFREILGPEIPPEENAGTAEIFAPFFDYRRMPPQRNVTSEGEVYFASGLVWMQSNRLDLIDLAFSYLDSTLNKRSKETGPDLTPKVDLEHWADVYREFAAKNLARPNPLLGPLELPTNATPASDVLASLNPARAILDETANAAALPRSQFPVHYEEAFDALLRHLGTIKAVQQALQRSCAAHLALGEADEAFDDTTNALNIAELAREEPLIISQLVRYAQLTIAVSTLWQGLDDHRWAAEHLSYFERQLARIDLLPGLVAAFEGERAGGNLSTERLINDPKFYRSFSGSSSLSRPFARGVLRQNQVALATYHLNNLNALRAGLVDQPTKGWIALMDEQQSDEFVMELARVYSPYRAMAAMIAPALSKASYKAARAQTTVQLASAACALERYRLAHGEFPEKLEQLVPEFCASTPLDPMVNQPFKYQRTDDGWFLLYSVGPDGNDNGGVFRSDNKTEREEKDWPWPVPTRPAKQRLF